MENIASVDQTAPWRNDPDATAAHRALREWNVLDRKDREIVVSRQSTLEAKQATIVAYGAALIEGRKRYPANLDFHRWIRTNKLNSPPFSDPKERANAMRIAVLGNSLRLEMCPFCWPTDIVKWLRQTGVVQPKKQIGQIDTARAHVRLAVAEGKPINRPEVTKETGVSDGAVNMAVAIERARLEGIAEGRMIGLEPHFTKAQQHHIEAAIRAKTKELTLEHNARVSELEKQFEAAVEARFQERKSVAWPALEKEKQEARTTKARYQKLLDGRDYPFPKTTYYDLLFLSHNKEVSEERKTRVSQFLIANKLRLIGEE